MSARNSLEILLLAAATFLLSPISADPQVNCLYVSSKFPGTVCSSFPPPYNDPEDPSEYFKITSTQDSSSFQIVRVILKNKEGSFDAFEKHQLIAKKLPLSNVIGNLIHTEYSEYAIEACEPYEEFETMITSIRERDFKPATPDIRLEAALIKNLVENIINLNNAGYVYQGSFHDLNIKYIPNLKRLVWRDLSKTKKIDSRAHLPTSEPALADSRYYDPKDPLKTIDTAVDAYRVGVIFFKLLNKPENFYKNPEEPGVTFNFEEATYTLSKGLNSEAAYMISRLLRAKEEDRLNLVSLLEFLKMAIENDSPTGLKEDIVIKAGGELPEELSKEIEYAHLKRFGTDLQREQAEKIKAGEDPNSSVLQGAAFWTFVILVVAALGFGLMMLLGKPNDGQPGPQRPVVEHSDREVTGSPGNDPSKDQIRKPLDP